MDLSSVSESRYAQRAFQPVFYQQPQYSQPGVPLSAAAGSPLPGSGWPADSTVWVSQSTESAGLEKAHVSEIGQRRLGSMAGVWEVQAWAVRQFQTDQNSQERAALASQFKTRNAIDTLMALGNKLASGGRSIDIYA